MRRLDPTLNPPADANQFNRPYPTAFQAGLSPSPYGMSYQRALEEAHFQQQQQQQQQQQYAQMQQTQQQQLQGVPSQNVALFQPSPAFSIAPPAPSSTTVPFTNELSAEEFNWLQYVRNHELLPYIDSRSSQSSSGNSGLNSSSSSLTVPGLERRGSLAPPSPKPSAGTTATGQQAKSKSAGFALVLNKITGIRIPPHIEARESRANLRFRVQVSFFDTLNKRFFGRTWVSPLCAVGSQGAPASFAQQVLYYRSSLYSEYCLAVIEYVCCVIRKESVAGDEQLPGAAGNAPRGPGAASIKNEEEVIVEKCSIGWTVLSLFSRDLTTLTDINDPQIDLEESIGEASLSMMDINATPAMIAASHTAKLKRKQLSKKLWAGTPRALLFMEPINWTAPQAGEWTKKLTQAVGVAASDTGGTTNSNVTLYYELFLCKALQPFYHLMREFEIFGSLDVLSGLPLINGVTNPLGLQKKIGRTRGACFPINPKDFSKIFLPLWTCKLMNPSIVLPANFESKMLERATHVKIIQWGGAEVAAEPNALTSSSSNLLAPPTPGAGGSMGGVLSAGATVSPLDSMIIGRTLVVGIHNGRKYIRAPYKLPLVVVANRKPNAETTDEAGEASTLRFEGEFNINDLMCSVDYDPNIAMTFELVYELRWNKAGQPQSSMTASIVAGWTVCLLSSPALSAGRLVLDGSPQTIALQRGPGRTLNNVRVYGFSDEAEESKRKAPGSILALTIAIEAQGFGTGGNEVQPQQQLVNRPVSPFVRSPLPAQQQAQQQQITSPMVPVSARMQQQQPQWNQSSPNRTTTLQPFSPGQNQHVSFSQSMLQQQQQQMAPNQFMSTMPYSQNQPIPPPNPYADDSRYAMNLQPAHGLSVGIQTGADLHYDTLVADEMGLNATTGLTVANRLGTSQGYSRAVPTQNAVQSFSGSINTATPTILGRPVQLVKELVDPLKACEIVFNLTHFSQTQEDYATNPIESLIFACHFFDQPYWRSARVPLQVSRDITYDPYKPQPHQLYNQADKLLSNNSLTVSTNAFHTKFHLTLSPFLHRLFVEYLYTKTLEIEVWNGDTFFQIGVVRIPLVQFLRQGQIQIERALEYPVMEVALKGSLFERDGLKLNRLPSTVSGSTGGSPDPFLTDTGVTKGLLGLTVVHVGHEVAPQDEAALEHTLISTIPSVSSSRLVNWGAAASIITTNKSAFAASSSLGSPSKKNKEAAALVATGEVALNTTINRPSRRRAKPLVESAAASTDPDLAASLRGLKASSASREKTAEDPFLRHNTGGSTRPNRPRPLHRAEILSASLTSTLGDSAGAALKMGNLSNVEKARIEEDMSIRRDNLRRIRQMREAQKAGQIGEMLRTSHSAIRTIYPSYGSLIFFEMAFTNPYPKRTRFRVRIDDPLLNPLYDPRQMGRLNDPTMQPECQVVRDKSEWVYLKQLYGLNTATSFTLFSEDDENDSNRFTLMSEGPPRSRNQDILHPGHLGSSLEESKDNTGSSSSKSDAVYIILEGGETAHIPLKFQSFLAGDPHNDTASQANSFDPLTFPTVEGTRMTPSYKPIGHRILSVLVESLEAVTAAYLRVDVRPQPFIIDKTLRFQHWSDEIVRGVIDLPRARGRQSMLPPATTQLVSSNPNDTYITPSTGLDLTDHPLNASLSRSRGAGDIALASSLNAQANFHITQSSRIQRVNCSSSEVAIEFQGSNFATQHGVVEDEAQAATEIGFKVRLGAFPSMHKFFLCLYTDAYCANLHSIIEVLVYAQLRAELSAVVGQRTTGRIFLPSTDRVRRVQMCASSSELSFGATNSLGNPISNSAPFLLQPGQVNTLDYVYRTHHSGKRSLLIHLVDLDSFDLVQSWCLFVVASYPRVNNVFNINLKVGQGARKAFDYENAYQIPRTFLFESSSPDRMKLREEVVSIPPLAVRSIHLVIAPQHTPGTDVLFVFINDEKGKNEECLQFNVHYKL